MPVAALAMGDDAGHLDLVHGEDHRTGSARLCERVAGRGKLREALALTTERCRYQQAQQAFPTQGGQGFFWRCVRSINSIGVRRGDLADRSHRSVQASCRNIGSFTGGTDSLWM